MQKHKRPKLCFGLKTSFLEELKFFESFQLVRKAIITKFVIYVRLTRFASRVTKLLTLMVRSS